MDLFELLYKAYPKKMSKGAARREFNKIKPDEDLVHEMIDKVVEYKKTIQWKDPKYIPHLSRFLRDGMWEDELEDWAFPDGKPKPEDEINLREGRI